MTDHSALIERLEETDPLRIDFTAERRQAAAALRDLTEWRDISTAPDREHPMFVVRAFDVRTLGGLVYTSDPVCVWRNIDGSFARWKQDFHPTHWLPLPSAPNQAKEAGE